MHLIGSTYLPVTVLRSEFRVWTVRVVLDTLSIISAMRQRLLTLLFNSPTSNLEAWTFLNILLFLSFSDSVRLVPALTLCSSEYEQGTTAR
jgi:hypothetical protein